MSESHGAEHGGGHGGGEGKSEIIGPKSLRMLLFALFFTLLTGIQETTGFTAAIASGQSPHAGSGGGGGHGGGGGGHAHH
jgi:hypothetical protein